MSNNYLKQNYPDIPINYITKFLNMQNCWTIGMTRKIAMLLE